MSHQQLPTARHDVVSRQVGEECIILDRRSETVHCLAGSDAKLWHALSTGSATELSPELVEDSLAKFVALDLVQLHEGGMDRRRLLQRAAAIGGAGIATLALSELPAFASSNVATTLTMTGVSTPQTGGSSHTATGKLTRTTGGAGVSGVLVSLMAQPLNNGGQAQGSPLTLGSATTAADGSYTITYNAPVARANGYNYYAQFAGNSTYTGTTSPTVTVVTT